MIDIGVLDSFRDILGPAGVLQAQEDIAPWLTDWRGRWHGESPAILSPSDTAQVAATVALANARGVPLVPQGGNTSMVGGATPPQDGSALILSLRRMNRIRAIKPQDNLAVCEAGVILQTLHEAAAAEGKRFPLSLGAKGSATIGGLISTNAGGTQVLRHGTMRALVEGIEAVLPDGSVYEGLAALKKDNRGYDLKQLLIGAEGTLGVVTAASLRLVPATHGRAVGWVGMNSPEDALRLLQRLQDSLGDGLEGFEIIPADALANVVAHVPGARRPIEALTPWHALIELITNDLGEASEGVQVSLTTALAAALETGLIIDAAIATSESQAEDFWRLRESISAAEKAKGPALQFDVSVPIARMPAFMVQTAAAVEARFHGTHATSYGHLGDGNVHFHVRAPAGTDGPSWTEGAGKIISAFVHDCVVAEGGSISAEHGIGQMKRAELGRLSATGRIGAMRAIKQALDPEGIMNPGKLVPLASEA